MSNLDHALDELLGIDWQLAPIEFNEPTEMMPGKSLSWSEYEHHLSMFLDRPLSDEDVIEAQKEIVIKSYLRSRFDRFEDLASRAQHFFKELTVVGGQEILASQANLDKWPVPGSCAIVRFKPPRLPADPPQTLEKYMDWLEIPQSFGARFLWKLAAWITPKEFGYSDTSLRSLFLQPMWFRISPKPAKRVSCFEELDMSWTCALDDRPIKLIQQAASLVALEALRVRSSSEPVEGEVTPRYGMTDDRNFYWGKKSLKLGPVQGPLMKLALDNYKVGKRVPQNMIEKVVWNNKPMDRSTISGHLSKLGTEFVSYKIPLELSFAEKQMALVYVGTEPNPLQGG